MDAKDQTLKAKFESLQKSFSIKKPTKLKVGFSNDTWRKRALRITYFITKFKMMLRTNTENIKFKLINRKVFSVIGDQSGDYETVRQSGLLYDKPTHFQKLLYNASKYFSSKNIITHNGPYPIFMPDSGFKTLWNGYVLLIIMINIFYLPLKIAFEIENNDQESPVQWFFFDMLPIITFMFEMIFNFNTGFYYEGSVHISRRKIASHYFQNNFLLDTAFVLPFFINYVYQFPFVNFFLLIRVAKVGQMIRYMEEVLNLREKYAATIDLSKLIYMMVFVSHFCACAFYYLGNTEMSYGYYSWLEEYGLADATKISQYINAIYWSTITILTVGYGDLSPVTDTEKVFCCIISIITIGVYAYIINNIGSIFKEMDEKKNLFKNQITKINFYLKKNNLNKGIQLKVQRYFEDFFQKQQDQDETEGHRLLKDLNEDLRQEVLVDIYLKILTKSKFLAENISVECLNALCIVVKNQKYHTNEIVMSKGQLTSRLFFLKNGGIQIYQQREGVNGKHIQVPLKNIKKKGHVLAEKQFILNQICEYSAKATMITTVSYIEYRDFIDVLRSHPQDYEKYCLMRDNLIFNKFYKKVSSVCEICGLLHSFGECPFPFHQPNKFKIYRQLNQSELMVRAPIHRRERVRNDITVAQDLGLLRIFDLKLIDKNILSDEYLEKLGYRENQDTNAPIPRTTLSNYENQNSVLHNINEEESQNNSQQFKRSASNQVIQISQSNQNDWNQFGFQKNSQQIPKLREDSDDEILKNFKINSVDLLEDHEPQDFYFNQQKDNMDEFDIMIPSSESNQERKRQENIQKIQKMLEIGTPISDSERLIQPEKDLPLIVKFNRRKSTLKSDQESIQFIQQSSILQSPITLNQKQTKQNQLILQNSIDTLNQSSFKLISQKRPSLVNVIQLSNLRIKTKKILNKNDLRSRLNILIRSRKVSAQQNLLNPLNLFKKAIHNEPINNEISIDVNAYSDDNKRTSISKGIDQDCNEDSTSIKSETEIVDHEQKNFQMDIQSNYQFFYPNQNYKEVLRRLNEHSQNLMNMENAEKQNQVKKRIEDRLKDIKSKNLRIKGTTRQSNFANEHIYEEENN